MKNIIYVPLEHLDNRYTVHLDNDINSYLIGNRIKHTRISPPYNSPPPPAGQFLNSVYTIKNKMQQLDQIAALYDSGHVTNDTTFFFSDLWFPGIESIAYLNYFHKIRPRLTGIIHAGSFTDTDFVRDMERWAKNFEDIIFDIADKVYCASYFLRRDILKKRICDERKLEMTRLPLDSALEQYRTDKKENIIVFNGRLCDEKQPWLFQQLKEYIESVYLGWVCVSTQETNLSKSDYYTLLAKSKVVVSYALQENFGFGILEAVRLGCVPVVPNRCVYPELFSSAYLYNTFAESVDSVEKAMQGQLQVPSVNIESPFQTWFKV